MKKACMITFAVLAMAACKDPKTTETIETETDTTEIDNSGVDATMPEDIVYTCPMHPEVIGNQSDKCPKCEMDLVVKDPTAAGE